MKNIFFQFLKHFPRFKNNEDYVPFSYFLLVIQWMDTANVRTKLAAIYYYINNGKPITAPMIASLLKFVYPETNPVRFFFLFISNELNLKVDTFSFYLGWNH